MPRGIAYLAARMKIPPGLLPLIEIRVIDEALRSLKSGKEATVYTVRWSWSW
jgi:hypothetical protein